MKKAYKCFYGICLLGCLTACSDWDEHYGTAGTTDAAEGTVSLWQQIKANPDLSDFAQVLEETKIFRQHRKTPVSYADLLDGGQSFTVVAPVNGTFDKDALLEMVQTAQGDSVVEKSFVQNHLSRSLSSVTKEDKRVLLLNMKYAEYADGMIEGVTITSPNQRARNGVLHVAASQIPYERNLYETLRDDELLSGIGAALHRYDEDYFDADNSISSGIVEGVPVYVDSVIIERNRMLDRLGYINREDSLYWVVAPTKDAWQQVWEETSQYFVYDESVLKRDSLQHHWTTAVLMQDAIFNMHIQEDITDSIVSVPYVRSVPQPGKPVYHVFYNPLEEGGVLYGGEPIQCSNGVVYKTDTWPYAPEQTFFRQMWCETENISNIIEEKMCTYNTRWLAADSISNGAYLQILPEKATSNWELTFRIPNTLSACYDIYAVVLPRTITHTDETFKPCKFKATINYVDEKGDKQSFNCGNTQFKADPARIDTVLLAEAFHFPACNYDQTGSKVSVKLQCSILPREQANYSREMYLDCIYLRPRKMNNE